MGPATGACFAMLDENSRALHVCESMASALKLRRYESGSVAVACDTTSLSECHTWGYIGCFRPIRLWINGDMAGQRAAWQAKQAFAKLLMLVSVMHLPDGGDFASAPLREVDNHDFGVQLREKFGM